MEESNEWIRIRLPMTAEDVLKHILPDDLEPVLTQHNLWALHGTRFWGVVDRATGDPIGYIELRTLTSGNCLLIAHNDPRIGAVVDAILALLRLPTQSARAKRDEDAQKTPRVPGRLADLNKWRACWSKVKSEWRRGKGYTEIRDWLHRVHPNLEYSEDVLAEIIAAGEAGRLDAD